jgi:hypothetical protein
MASSWNKDLAEFAGRFATNREEIKFALDLRTAVTVEEINTKCVVLSIREHLRIDNVF